MPKVFPSHPESSVNKMSLMTVMGDWEQEPLILKWKFLLDYDEWP